MEGWERNRQPVGCRGGFGQGGGLIWGQPREYPSSFCELIARPSASTASSFAPSPLPAPSEPLHPRHRVLRLARPFHQPSILFVRRATNTDKRSVIRPYTPAHGGGCCHLRVEVQRKTCRANPACKLRGIYTKKSLTGGGEGGGGVEDYFFSFFLFFFQRKFQHRARYIITSCRVREMGSAVLRGGGWAGRIRCRVLSPLEF